MSKRIRLSLLPTLPHTLPALPKCSALKATTARGNTSPPCLHRRQPFSTTPHHRVSAQRMMAVTRKSQPSIGIQIKAQQAAAMRDGIMLDHLGLLDHTFVPPSGKNLPSYFSDWTGRWQLQIYRLKSFRDEMSAYFAAWFLVKPRPKLEKNKIPGIAKDLYEEMYRHFAAGSISKIEAKLAPGFRANLKNRIAERPPNTELQWTLHGYYGKPELMSYKFSVFTEHSESENRMGIAQAVVRIKSRQSLLHMKRIRTKGINGNATSPTHVQQQVLDEQGNPVPAQEMEQHQERNVKVTTEYLVVQRFMKNSRFEPWHIWGTTEETTVAKMKKQEKEYTAKLAAQQRMKDGK